MTRGRAGAAVAVLAALSLAAWLAFGRGGDDGPPDGAARLVPSDALVYVHLSTDRDRAPDRRLGRFAGALPAITRLSDAMTAEIVPPALDLDRDMRPWLGREIAYAALSSTDAVLLAAVADRRRAEEQVARIGDLDRTPRHRGVPLLVAGPTALAFVGDFLAVGTEAAVRAAIDRDRGAGEALGDLPAYRTAAAGFEAGRSIDAYASASGVREVLVPRGGVLGALGALLDRPGLEAARAAVTAEDGGLRAEVRLAGGAPRDAGFEPLLLERVPEDAAAYLGMRGAPRLVRLLERLGAAEAVAAVRAALPEEAGLSLDRDVLDPLSGELALSVSGPADDPEGSSAGAPVVTLKARTDDAPRTEDALARLQAPLSRLLAVQGTIPAFRPATIGGLEGYSMRVTPELAPSYAVTADGLVASTAPAGLAPPRGTLAAAAGFEATVGRVPDRADSLLFLDLRQLRALGEQTGLTSIPGLAAALEDLGRAGAAGAVVTQDPANPSDTTAELFFQIP